MNPMHQMKDPAAGVAPQLLPHMHLISKYRYPIANNPSLETIVGYLLEAPKIVRDLQPVQWQLIDAPTDGSIMLVWQPLEYMGTNMASDGYIWGDAEQVAKSDVRGYTLEMYLHRTGYRAQGEAMASHSRRRYRLMPSNPNLPSPDPALFIIHYSKASSRDTLPAASIPIIPQIAQQVQQRRVIQSQGQLARKDFMLHDRSNWPQIQAPPGVARAAAGPAGAVGHRRGPSIGQGEPTIEEEEDVSRGDILDFMTPRDISRMRYEQHHEWMEEILESPYNIFQIVPGDLGLGRKGELEHLTKDFFDAPMTVLRETSGNVEPARVGKMANDRAGNFKKCASDKLASMQVELEKMRLTHAKRMERLRRTTMLNAAEKRLRNASTATNGRTMSTGSVVDDEDGDALDEIAKEIETSSGKKIERVSAVNLVSRGGLEERAVTRTMSTSSAGRPQMSPVKAQASPSFPHVSMQQAMGQTDGASSQPTEIVAPPARPEISEQLTSAEPPSREQDQDQDQDPDQDQGQDQEDARGQDLELEQEQDQDEDLFGDQTMAEEALNAGNETPADESNEADRGTELPAFDDMDMDMNMDVDVDLVGLENEQQEDAAPAEGDEWVMVDERTDPAPVARDAQPDPEAASAEGGMLPALADTQEETGEVMQGEPQLATSVPEETPQSKQQLNTNDFDVSGAFDDVDVDTAGDALASYDTGNDEELNLDNMDDNFGDAFHQDQDDQDIS